MPYNVYLTSLGESGLSEGDRTSVSVLLQSWFTQIVSRTSFNTAAVQWVTSPPNSIQNQELLIYFVLSPLDSVVRNISGQGGTLSHGGNTGWNTTHTASEVYVQNASGGLAELAFHECMHNKLHIENQLHTRNGLAVSPITPGTVPSAQNISDMRGAINANQPQWLGGWSAMNDPLSDLGF